MFRPILLVIYDLVMLIVLQINRNQGTGDNEEKKCYEDKEIFSAQKEVSECDQVGALHKTVGSTILMGR